MAKLIDRLTELPKPPEPKAPAEGQRWCPYGDGHWAPESAFGKRKRPSGRVNFNSYCRECQHAKSHEHYVEHEADYVARAADGKAKMIAWLHGTKAGKPCVRCARTLEPERMNWRTRDTGHIVGVNIAMQTGKAAIAEWIENCELFCEECWPPRHGGRQAGRLSQRTVPSLYHRKSRVSD